MQHQYWVTKKSVLRKLGGKEDDCIVSSDAELDAKLELFKSINESCVQLQRVVDLYQERLCYLAQEENALGRYLKEHAKSEQNASAGQLMAAAGKALAYAGHQRLAARPPLVRLHHEVDTFRARAVADTRATVLEMEKARTEYRAALSWMKSASGQLDPDTGSGLERFRKAQAYVKTSKAKFDRYTLACLQKVDLLAAARCNMFSHALVPYQAAVAAFAARAAETLALARDRLDDAQPFEFSTIAELAAGPERDKGTFFSAEYSDREEKKADEDEDLLGADLAPAKEEALLDLDWAGAGPPNDDFMPSRLLQGDFDFSQMDLSALEEAGDKKKTAEEEDKNGGRNVSWLSLFAELDPLSNANHETNAGDRA